MSDAAVATIVAGMVQCTGMIVGFLILWTRLRYAEGAVRSAATKVDVVERKLDANTTTTESVYAKADTIVNQTNGAMEATRSLVVRISERVDKLEEYNHDSVHRLLDVINLLSLKVERVLVMQEVKPPIVLPQPIPPKIEP